MKRFVVRQVRDIDPALGLSRAKTRAGSEMRFEDMGLALHLKARAAFLDLAAMHPKRFRIIDGQGGEAEVAARVRAALP